jgi:hypothetical protein
MWSLVQACLPTQAARVRLYALLSLPRKYRLEVRLPCVFITMSCRINHIRVLCMMIYYLDLDIVFPEVSFSRSRIKCWFCFC